MEPEVVDERARRLRSASGRRTSACRSSRRIASSAEEDGRRDGEDRADLERALRRRESTSARSSRSGRGRAGAAPRRSDGISSRSSVGTSLTQPPRCGARPASTVRLISWISSMKLGLERHVDRARAGKVDVEDAREPAGTGRHHDDAIGEEDRLADVVGDEDDRLARSPSRGDQQQVHLVARECVERAEGLVHETTRRGRARERARSMRAAACRPRARAGMALSKPASPVSSSEAGDALPVAIGCFLISNGNSMFCAGCARAAGSRPGTSSRSLAVAGR